MADPPQKIAELVHQKSIEILQEVGFCVPDGDVLRRLDSSGFIVDFNSQMVRITTDLLDAALESLPGDVRLYDRDGGDLAKFGVEPCFMGAGTPVNVFDLHSGVHRSATRQDVQNLVTIQDALAQVDIVRPTVTATDQGEYSDMVEIFELLRNTAKPVVHRVLSPSRVDAAVEMLFAVAGGERSFPPETQLCYPLLPDQPRLFHPRKCPLHVEMG